MTALTSFVFCFAGCVALCLAMRRHWKVVFSQRRDQPRSVAVTLRVLGSTFLLLAAAFPIIEYGAGVGTVMFLGLFTVAQFLLAVVLPYLPEKRVSTVVG